MQIDGITYLLGKPDRGDEFVSRYLASEMAELFTEGERIALDLGEAVIHRDRHGATRYIDMVRAARGAA